MAQRAQSRLGAARRLVVASDGLARRSPALSRTAMVSGAIFIIAGLVKFALHHWELHAFRSFGLPWASELEILAGVIETGGGILLVMRRLIAPVAVTLSITMLVAVISSGILHGDVIPSLTLAPALLLAMLYLLARTVPPSARLSATPRAV